LSENTFKKDFAEYAMSAWFWITDDKQFFNLQMRVLMRLISHAFCDNTSDLKYEQITNSIPIT
jgi:hypothetical protein